MTQTQARRWLYWMIQSRLADQAEESLIRQGRGASFQMSAGGHEALCVLQDCLTDQDWIYPHYRDRALMLARGLTQKDLFAAYFANEDSSSGGRQMTAHFSSAAHRVVSLSSPVGSSALHAVGTAAAVRAQGAVVLCLLGDATTQQGEVYEAIAQAANDQVPVIFCIEDNGYGISTSTSGKTFWNRTNNQEFLGVPLYRTDALDPQALFDQAQRCIATARQDRGPQILICRVERLASHSSSDAQNVYRPKVEMATLSQRDPLLQWQQRGLATGWWTQAELDQAYAQAQAEIDLAIQATEPGPAPMVGDLDQELFAPSPPVPPALLTALTHHLEQAGTEITLRQVLCDTLGFLLDQEPGTFLFGQDIEDPKGDVFGLTRGLSTRFGPRVQNSPLAEATILGTCVGRALAGERPIAFLQFIDFVGPGFNQILSEVATMHWRTLGQWQCPMVIMAPSGAYRAGLGPYHAQSNEAIFAHIPGLDVVMPSSPLEASYLLLKAFWSRRPTLYLYPKALLNQRFPAGQGPEQTSGRVERVGRDVTLVGWGNTVGVCHAAATALALGQIQAEVLSIQSLSPLPMELIAQSVARTQRVVVVHEDNQTCGLGAEILVRLQEQLSCPFSGRRVTRPDTYLPFHFGSQLSLLPSVEQIQGAVYALGLTQTIVPCAPTYEPLPTTGLTIPVPLPRIAPSDEAATLIAWHVTLGERVEAGQVIADVEGDKAIFELEAPQAGVITALLYEAGALIAVETIIAELEAVTARPIVPTPRPVQPTPPVRYGAPRIIGIGAFIPQTVVTNEDLLMTLPSIPTVDWIVQRTGIHQRPVAHTDVVQMGTQAAFQAIAQAGLSPEDINWIIVATTTPPQVIPSTACQIQGRIGAHRAAAFDIFATCSGFIYALTLAQGHLALHPHHHVLVITAEKMRSVVNPQDVNTAILFGDAATACVVSTRNSAGFILEELAIYAEADQGESIALPPAPSYLHMDGTSVFRTAVLRMAEVCEEVRLKHRLEWSDIAWVIPHQANIRILQALAKRLKIPEKRVFSNIETLGNTSSSSIPLCLAQMQTQGLLQHGQHLLICAVGGGITYGAGYLRYVER